MSLSKNILYILWIIHISYAINDNTTNIICSTEDDCFVSCQTNNCNHKSIRCPSDNLHRCHIICESAQSCKHTTIFANNSRELNLICNAPHSCSGITLHCPYVYSTNQQKHPDNLCKINIKQNTNSDVTIYANQGWKTMRLLNYTQYNTTFAGTLNCKSNQQSDPCEFDLTQSSQCINPYHQCNSIPTQITTQIYQSTTTLRTSMKTNPNEKSGIWDELKSIHYLWWIIVSLMFSIICLICVLLIYMRIQNNITKNIAEVHRISQTVSDKYTGKQISQNSQPQTHSNSTSTIIKLKSLSEEKTSETTTHIPLQSARTHTQPLRKQFSVPTHSNSVFKNTIPLKRSQSYSNKYESSIEMNNINSIKSDHSYAKTLTFKQRKEVVNVMPTIPVNISNTTTASTQHTANINSSNSNHSSPQYNNYKSDTNESETLSIASGGSSNKSLHNSSSQHLPVNRFYPQRSDPSYNTYQQQMYNLQRNNYNYNQSRNNRMIQLQRYKSCPQPQLQRPQPQRQNYMQYPMQKRPLRRIISQQQQSISPQLTYTNTPPLKPTVLNLEQKEQISYTDMNNNDVKLQHAMQQAYKDNNYLHANNKHENTDTLWTDASMIGANCVLSLDNEPKTPSGIHGMMPGMFENTKNNKSNSSDNKSDSNGSDNNSIDSSDVNDNMDRSY